MQQVPLHAVVADVCDPGAGLGLLRATSSEPDDAPGGGDGATTGDITTHFVGRPRFPGRGERLPDTLCDSVGLRAERVGGGPGRVYRIVCISIDRSGNSTTAETTVVVPATGPAN
jgi:hypothetical protein